MPAVPSKIYVETNTSNMEDKMQIEVNCKPKSKDRSNGQKTETIWERLSHAKKPKQGIVPDLNLKGLETKTPHKKNRTRKDRNSALGNLSSARMSDKLSARKRLIAIGNAYSKSNQQSNQLDSCRLKSCFIDEMRTSDSLSCISPRPGTDIHLADLENINPNQLVDTVEECKALDEFYRSQFFDFENLSEFEYQTPKSSEQFEDLHNVDSEKSFGQGAGVLRHFKELLDQEETSKTNLLAPNEILILKNIVKTDERHQKLQRDDYNLLKEILVGQLKEVAQQERVIKLALKKIRNRNKNEIEVTTLRVDNAEQPMENTSRSARSTRLSELSSAKNTNSARIKSIMTPRSPRQEVDVIFKNVPSLEKEIRILRSLGMKLEETLKKSSVRIKGYPVTLHNASERYFRHCLGIPLSTVNVQAKQCNTEIAQEFRIRHQTIDELKLERDFFIPADIDSFVLEKTNFDQLSRNPELLLRRMKPLLDGSDYKFNIIEQDPMFFNHFLARICKTDSDEKDLFQESIDDSKNRKFNSEIGYVKSGAGDHPDHLFNGKTSPKKFGFRPVKTSSNLRNKSCDSLDRKKKEKLCKGSLTEDGRITPKNNLVKIFLLGTVQLSILFTVVAAMLYTSFNCD